jgi:hypothetical protein
VRSEIVRTLLSAAVAGMALGASRAVVPGGSVDSCAALDADAGDKHACKGQNGCKGLGGCKTDKHACKGQNACKGQGGCRTDHPMRFNCAPRIPGSTAAES